jgi:hypothetical protein
MEIEKLIEELQAMQRKYPRARVQMEIEEPYDDEAATLREDVGVVSMEPDDMPGSIGKPIIVLA